MIPKERQLELWGEKTAAAIDEWEKQGYWVEEVAEVLIISGKAFSVRLYTNIESVEVYLVHMTGEVADEWMLESDDEIEGDPEEVIMAKVHQFLDRCEAFPPEGGGAA